MKFFSTLSRDTRRENTKLLFLRLPHESRGIHTSFQFYNSKNSAFSIFSFAILLLLFFRAICSRSAASCVIFTTFLRDNNPLIYFNYRFDALQASAHFEFSFLNEIKIFLFSFCENDLSAAREIKLPHLTILLTFVFIVSL